MYINWLNWIIFIHDRILCTNIGVNKNPGESLNTMVNYHYHGENRFITRYLPYVLARELKATIVCMCFIRIHKHVILFHGIHNTIILVFYSW